MKRGELKERVEWRVKTKKVKESRSFKKVKKGLQFEFEKALKYFFYFFLNSKSPF